MKVEVASTHVVALIYLWMLTDSYHDYEKDWVIDIVFFLLFEKHI